MVDDTRTPRGYGTPLPVRLFEDTYESLQALEWFDGVAPSVRVRQIVERVLHDFDITKFATKTQGETTDIAEELAIA